ADASGGFGIPFARTGACKHECMPCPQTPAEMRARVAEIDEEGEHRTVVELLRGYLRQQLTVDEIAWARWELVDHLAMARLRGEAVAEQKAFIAWARECLDGERLPWVVCDLSQALCWLETEQGDDWVEMTEELIGNTPGSAANRLDRFHLLRTRGHILASLGRFDGARHAADGIAALAVEDPAWAEAARMDLERSILLVHVLRMEGDVASLRDVGQRAARTLRERPFSEESLATLNHNLASALYRAGQYDLATPLFECALSLGVGSPHCRLWLAACLTATGGPAPRIGELLDDARRRIPPSRWKRALAGAPELTRS
ncbi:MAG TPA: hypothetical protein VF155_05665, partial [Candidatus Dormibacteraeota bacterium]